MMNTDQVTSPTPLPLFSTLWGILKLDTATYKLVKKADNSFWLALCVFLIIGLFVSIGKLAVVGNIMNQPTLAERVQSIGDQFIQSGQEALLFKSVYTMIGEQINKVAENIVEAQPPLGPRPSRIIRLVGSWIQTPFTLLGWWMTSSLSLFVMVIILKGKGSLREHITLLLFSFMPQILTFLNYITFQNDPSSTLSGIKFFLFAIAFIWSVLIAVRALMVAHEMTTARAVSTLALTFVFVGVVIPFLIASFWGLVIGGLLSIVL